MSEYINNQSKRKEALKDVIRQLHEGKTVDEVKAEFAALLQGVGGDDIAEIEQALIAEGLPETEIKRLCDVHVAVFRETLDAQEEPASAPGHPVDTFRAENEAAAKVLDALDGAIRVSDWAQARKGLAKLQEYDRHYLRKENVLFPYLEKHGFTGPSSVMWATHDDVRAGWKYLSKLLAGEPDAAQVTEVFEPLAIAIREMFYKEENILFPTALEKLTLEEWAEIRAQEAEVGYCYVELDGAWIPGETAPRSAEPAPAVGDLVPLNTGALTLQQIDWLLTNLPVDVTYVDANDDVRFFSATKERIFPRSSAIVGRKVQKCHPPASVHRVQRIVDDFRAGRRDEAEFWIQMGGKFIHIRYFAIRDEQGVYQGTLEVSQDVTAIRALEGERRLLDEEE
ncbi:MAG: DUF438 domain-containing protein [Anaerolineae bacterium]|nr:DUF438 domain-containing protein [Anaerolineae bacterium]